MNQLVLSLYPFPAAFFPPALLSPPVAVSRICALFTHSATIFCRDSGISLAFAFLFLFRVCALFCLFNTFVARYYQCHAVVLTIPASPFHSPFPLLFLSLRLHISVGAALRIFSVCKHFWIIFRALRPRRDSLNKYVNGKEIMANAGGKNSPAYTPPPAPTHTRACRTCVFKFSRSLLANYFKPQWIYLWKYFQHTHSAYGNGQRWAFPRGQSGRENESKKELKMIRSHPRKASPKSSQFSFLERIRKSLCHEINTNFTNIIKSEWRDKTVGNGFARPHMSRSEWKCS